MADNKKWYKVWTSLLIDPDFDSLHNQAVGVWLRLGALVASQGKSGKITLSKEQFLKRSHMLQADEGVTQGVIEVLKKVSLIVTETATGEVTVTFKKWSKYQAFSESYDRVKKFREKQKCNASETPYKEEEENKKKNKKETKNKKEKKNELTDKIIIPKWVPLEEWNGFVEMRSGMKKPLSNRSTSLCLTKLEKLKLEGHEPFDVLNQSIMNHYQGLFPVRSDYVRPSNGDGKHENFTSWVENKKKEMNHEPE